MPLNCLHDYWLAGNIQSYMLDIREDDVLWFYTVLVSKLWTHLKICDQWISAHVPFCKQVPWQFHNFYFFKQLSSLNKLKFKPSHLHQARLWKMSVPPLKSIFRLNQQLSFCKYIVSVTTHFYILVFRGESTPCFVFHQSRAVLDTRVLD